MNCIKPECGGLVRPDGTCFSCGRYAFFEPIPAHVERELEPRLKFSRDHQPRNYKLGRTCAGCGGPLWDKAKGDRCMKCRHPSKKAST